MSGCEPSCDKTKDMRFDSAAQAPLDYNKPMGRRKKRYPDNLTILAEYRQWRKDNPKADFQESITEVDCPECSAKHLTDMEPGVYFKQKNGDLLMKAYCKVCEFRGYVKVYSIKKADKLDK